MPITASASRSRDLAGGNDKMGGAEIRMSCAPSGAYPNCHGEASNSPTICMSHGFGSRLTLLVTNNEDFQEQQ